MSLKIHKSSEFCTDVLNKVIAEEITYIESVLAVCDDWEILPESVGSLIDEPIKERLAAEFSDINLLPEVPSLEALFID